uniref:RING-type E3 ubiquitin transferase n=1 Tax=Leptobrachium leishanense TaxID=445787 RepID=A0A8C5QL72_9ANUR
MLKSGNAPLTWSECMCPICREILLEPVTLPCNHTLCKPCFQSTVEKASLCCPFCRKRVSTWARYHARSGTMVNVNLWKKIQSQYPEECQRRASGQDNEDLEEESISCPSRLLCKPGEIRQEYEEEISKIEAERLAQEETERKASEDYIKNLLAEEEEHQRRAAAIRIDMEEQLKRDEELARSISNDLNGSSTSFVVSPEASPLVCKEVKKPKSRKRSEVKGSQSRAIERFLLPKHHGNIVMNAEPLILSPSSESVTSVFEENGNEMPTLSPQVTLPVENSSRFEPDPDEYTFAFNEYSTMDIHSESENSSDLATDSVHDGSYSSRVNGNGIDVRQVESGANFEQAVLSFPSASNCEEIGTADNFSGCNSVTSTPKPLLRKRKSEEFYRDPAKHMEDCVNGKRRRTLDDVLLQEEKDRLLALQLQKEMDKEMKQVIRNKGSPDAYQLRPKRGNDQQDQGTTPIKEEESKTNTPQAKAARSKSGSSPDENNKPQRKKPRTPVDQPNPSVKKVKVLWPSNKQQTILQLFQKSSGK